MKKFADHGEERDVRMSMVQKDCDYYGKPYPPELTQWLAERQTNDG